MNVRQALDAAQEVVHEEMKIFFSSYKPKVVGIDRWSHDIIIALEEYCSRPGKAVRPLLIALGHSLAAKVSLEESLQNPQVRQLMLAFEMTHKRILMADDIADQDELRNELPAFHLKLEQELAKREVYQNISHGQLEHFARSYTEVAGIWLQTLSFAVIERAQLTSEQRDPVLATLLSYVYEKTPAGWYILLDQNLEKLDEKVSYERFLKGLELVTGEYTFVAPLRLGFILGGQLASHEAAIAEFGASAGILFQLTDDRIGLFGDPEISGKPVGNDLREGKKTLYVQFAYALANAQQKQQLTQIVGKSEVSASELLAVQTLVNELGVYQKVEQEIEKYHQKAQVALTQFFDNSSRIILEDLIQYIVKRTK